MGSLGKDGVSKRDHLLAAANHPFAADLSAAETIRNAPELPTLAAHLWAKYCRLDGRRGHTEAGPVRFSWQEVKAFVDLTGERVNAWELDTIFRLDDLFLKTYWDNWRANNPPKN